MAPTKGFVGFLLCMAMLLGGCDQLRPFEQVCEKRLGPGGVTVEAARTELKRDFSQGVAELSARGARSTGSLVLGITEGRLKTSVGLGGNGVVKPWSGRFCTRPEVKVSLAYSPMTVYVAREHAPGSCAHDLTLNHEMKHVRDYERFIDELAGRVEDAVKRAIGPGIRHYASAAEGERDLDARVGAAVKAVVEAGMRELEARQRAIDSPEEYGRLDLMQSKCG